MNLQQIINPFEEIYHDYMLNPNAKSLERLCRSVLEIDQKSKIKLYIMEDDEFDSTIRHESRLLGAYIQPDRCYVRLNNSSDMIVVGTHEIAHSISTFEPYHELFEPEAELYEILVQHRLRHFTDFKPTVRLNKNSIWFNDSRLLYYSEEEVKKRIKKIQSVK